jgi:hypothetical protein
VVSPVGGRHAGPLFAHLRSAASRVKGGRQTATACVSVGPCMTFNRHTQLLLLLLVLVVLPLLLTACGKGGGY